MSTQQPTTGAGQIRAAIERYVACLCKGDVDGIAALYADDATVEDPVGNEPVVGLTAVRAFYASAVGRVRVELTGPIRVAKHEAGVPHARPWGLRHAPGRDGRDRRDEVRRRRTIASMRAFWSPQDMRPARG